LALSFPLDDQFKTRTEGNLNTVEGLKKNIPWSLWGIRPVESSVIDILFTIPRFIWVTLSKAFNANFGCGILLACFYVYSFIGVSILLQEQLRDFSISFTGDLVHVGGGFFSPGVANGSLSESFTVDSFKIDRFEVSEKQFQTFLDDSNHISPATAEFKDFDGNQPVTNVTIYEARAYCEHYGKRLPTEVEWEWAARDMSSYSDGSLSGFDWDRTALPVDSSSLNHGGKLGLYGMVSSVGEWTEFRFRSTEEKDEEGNYVFPVRGGTLDGSWRAPYLDYSLQQQPNAFIRKLFKGDGRSPYIGFRCAKNSD
jgi:formylglycine-generating enzyme required for sulfatase activity